MEQNASRFLFRRKFEPSESQFMAAITSPAFKFSGPIPTNDFSVICYGATFDDALANARRMLGNELGMNATHYQLIFAEVLG